MIDEQTLKQEFDAWDKWELFTRDPCGTEIWAKLGYSEFRVVRQNSTLYQGRSLEFAVKIFLDPYGYLPVQKFNCLHCKAPLAEKLSVRQSLGELYGLEPLTVPPGRPIPAVTYLRCFKCGTPAAVSRLDDTEIVVGVR